MVWVTLATVLALVANVPAHLLAELLWPNSGGLLSQVQGTLWSGTARIRIGRASAVPLTWNFAAEGLTRGCLLFSIDTGSARSGEIARCVAGLEVKRLSLEVPVQTLAVALQIPAAAVAGRATWRIDSLNTIDGGLSGDGSLVWRDAAAGIGTKIRLGEMHCQLTLKTNTVAFQIRNQQGEVNVILDGGIDSSGNYRATGFLSVPSRDAILMNQLLLFGDRLADGRIAVRQRGRLRL
jgi:hypothetical protein